MTASVRDEDDDDGDDLLADRPTRSRDTAAEATRAFVLHPDLKAVRARRLPEHGLAEAVALAAALPGLEVVGADVVYRHLAL